MLLNVSWNKWHKIRKNLHQAELHIARRSTKTSAAYLNGRLAAKRSHKRSLHEAQIISMIK